MASFAATINLPEEKKGYLRIAYEFLEDFVKLSLAEIFSLSKVASFSLGIKNENIGCHSRMSDFSKDLNITERHSSRVIKKCLDEKYIERCIGEDEKIIKSWYKYTGAELKKGYIRVDIANLYREFKFKADKDHEKPYYRRLTLAETLVLSFMITCADNVKKKSGTFSGSYRSIARKLRISPTTVGKAVLSLMKTGMISRPKEDTAVNGSGWSTYHIDKSLLIRTQEEELKQFKKSFIAQGNMQGTSKAPATESNAKVSDGNKPEWQKRIDDIDPRAERESYYSRLRQKAENRAEYFKSIAEKDAGFKENKKELDALSLELSR